ncbi:MAG TPA: 2Fe-2S iron-sulfur cluster-binding protein [Burkholderiales bacterium]|nr:2Fe-2S iron-sulfur cluster-binding protein [Burkholderiales bacterium]
MPHEKGASAPFFIRLEGSAEPIAAEAGETILTSLLRSGVPFPFSCQTGTCGACKCLLVEGDIVQLAFSERVLSREEQAKGIILACRSVPRSGGVLRRID